MVNRKNITLRYISVNRLLYIFFINEFVRVFFIQVKC